ncbi:MAG: hypothetical protein KJ737_03725 [Proteobacteria bacterium]|nr:hypothetical protein [Pseudomonadota bacterium]
MTDQKTNEQEELVCIQDGCKYPKNPPWSPVVTKLTSLWILIFFLAGVYGTLKVGFSVFFIWTLIFCIKLYVIRYIVCARCPYYGENCSCFYGKLAARLFEKQENKSMKMGLWIDCFVWYFIFLYPLYYYLKLDMDVYAMFWVFLFFAMSGTLSVLACSTCPFEFCPQGYVGRIVGKIMGLRK